MEMAQQSSEVPTTHRLLLFLHVMSHSSMWLCILPWLPPPVLPVHPWQHTCAAWRDKAPTCTQTTKHGSKPPQRGKKLQKRGRRKIWEPIYQLSTSSSVESILSPPGHSIPGHSLCISKKPLTTTAVKLWKQPPGRSIAGTQGLCTTGGKATGKHWAES